MFLSIVTNVLDTIRGIGDGIANQFSRNAIANTTDAYVLIQNQVREGVIIGLVALNMVTYGLFFLGIFQKQKALLKMFVHPSILAYLVGF